MEVLHETTDPQSTEVTWRHPTPLEHLELEEACIACGAAQGEWCETRSGKPADLLHAPRYRKAFEKRRKARSEGRRLP